jgi:peroxiredoxin family protein
VDSSRADAVVIFLNRGDYASVHQGLSVAAAAAAAGRKAEIFFFWWALKRLVEDRLDEPDFSPEPGGEEVADRFEERGMPTLRQLLGQLRELGGCRLYACSGSLAALDVKADTLERRVDSVVGWSAILRLTQGVTDRFFF